jgi:hypothetical protein
MPRRGLLVDAVIKSGGNDFHGNVTFYASGPQLEANNIDDTLKAAGIRLAKLDVIRDTSANMGGRIVRNKLWFFGGGRYEQVVREILDAFDPLGDPTGTPLLNKKGAPYWFAKGSYQATEANRFTSFFHWTNDLELRGAGRFVPRESMEEGEPGLDDEGRVAGRARQFARGLGAERAVGLRRRLLGSCTGEGVDHRHPDSISQR